LQVTGTWSATADGHYVDRTTTTGSETFTLSPSCLLISGTVVTCSGIASVLTVLGYDTVDCASAAGGGCTCAATVNQTSWPGIVSLDATTAGAHATTGNVLTLDDEARYAYCVSGNRMLLTPQGANPTVTGTIVLQSWSSNRE
jgi:hypothetical protein